MPVFVYSFLDHGDLLISQRDSRSFMKVSEIEDIWVYKEDTHISSSPRPFASSALASSSPVGSALASSSPAGSALATLPPASKASAPSSPVVWSPAAS